MSDARDELEIANSSTEQGGDAMKVDLDAIERVAKEATPGPWESDLDIFTDEEGVVAVIWDRKDMLVKIETGLQFTPQQGPEWTLADEERKNAVWSKAKAGQENKDAAFIAQCSPDVVLELVARIRELERLVHEYEREHKQDCIREIGKRAGYWDCDCEP